MHTQGIEERLDSAGRPTWFVRSECCGCKWRVGVDVLPSEGIAWVDRMLWTDEARAVLDRLPPYIQDLVRREVEGCASKRGLRVITFDLQWEARRGDPVTWDPEAEQRLANVPAPVRAMAKLELERTAAESGESRVTVGLMEQVKARYFGIRARS